MALEQNVELDYSQPARCCHDFAYFVLPVVAEQLVRVNAGRFFVARFNFALKQIICFCQFFAIVFGFSNFSKSYGVFWIQYFCVAAETESLFIIVLA